MIGRKYNVLAVGGKIIDVWPFNYKYDRSAVYFVVMLKPEMKEFLEDKFEGKIKFTDPPTVKLNYGEYN